jgi:multisubunit Na+/H+ antiporter MnhC subunit
MGKIVFVEILDRRGNVRERVKVDSFPATVGRGYANAVIVDDRLVDAEHLMLSLDSEAGIIVEDLNTESGTRLSKSRIRVEQCRVPAGGEAVLRIGQTVLRLRGDDFAVEPVAPSQTLFGPFGRWIESNIIAFLVFVAAFSLYVLVFAQEITKKVIWSDLTGRALVLLIIFALWTGFWSFFSRLVVHSFRFMTHLGISSGASIVFLVLFTAEEYFEFLSSAPVAAGVAGYAGFAVIFSLLLYGHLSVMSESSRWKRMLSSVLISTGIVSVILLSNYAHRKEFSNELRFSSVIKPIGHKWVRTVSPDRFFSDLDTLKARIDAMAQEGPIEKVAKK